MDNCHGLVNKAIFEGIVKETTNGFVMSCPKCGRDKILKTRENVRRSLRYNKACNKCLNKIKALGVKHTDEWKTKMSVVHKIQYSNINEREKMSDIVKAAMHRPEVRKKHIKALVESKYLGKSVDRGQLELLDKWNKLGFNFEINYQLYTDDFLCYIDGYDKEKNVVLEYDSLYHQKLGQKQKDLIRQNKIIEILKPKKFWRYDSVNKKFNEIC